MKKKDTKKVFFHTFEITEDTTVGEKNVTNDAFRIISDILNQNPNGNTLQLKSSGSTNHVDVFENNEDFLFARVGATKLAHDFALRCQESLETTAVITQENQDTLAIEKGTFFYINYSTGIITYISAGGVPSAAIIASIVNENNLGKYQMIVRNIISKEAKELIRKPNAQISKVECRVIVPNADVLEADGISSKQIIDFQTGNELIIDYSIKAAVRGRPLFVGMEEVGKVIDNFFPVFSKKGKIAKAVVKGKAAHDGLSEEYSLMEQKCTANVTINFEVNERGQITTSPEEYAQEVLKKLQQKYNEQKGYLKAHSGRNR